MFVPHALAQRVNEYVLTGPTTDAGLPAFKRGAGVTMRESGNILRFVSSTASNGRRYGVVGQAYLDAKARQRAERLAREAAKRKHTQRSKRRSAAIAMARVAKAKRSVSA